MTDGDEGTADTAAATALGRALTVLWRDRARGEAPYTARKGPKQRLSVDQVIEAAIALADEQGLQAVTIRRVAESLGVGAMSLYTYIPGRDELVGIMLDHVLVDAPKPDFVGSLRERLTLLADAHLDSVQAHPWIVDVDTSRPLVGPGGSDLWEWQLAAVDGLGLDDFEMHHAVSLVTGFATVSARAIVELHRTQSASDETDSEWWAQNAPLLERLMPPGRYPLSGRVGTTIGEAYQAATNPYATYRFGLERIIDGLESYLAQRS